MRPFARAASSSALALLAFFGWLISERWDLLGFSDLVAVAAIGLAAGFGLCTLLWAIYRSSFLSRLAKGWIGKLSIPLIGGLAWYVFIAWAINIVVEVAVRSSSEHIFNNAVQFLWSRTDFMPLVLLALLGGEIFLKDHTNVDTHNAQGRGDLN